MTVNRLFQKADNEASKLQGKQGRTPKGITSTQVQGLIIAMALEIERLEKEIKKLKTGNL